LKNDQEPEIPSIRQKERNVFMRKTNEELDTLIEEQQENIAESADMVDVHRGHVSKSFGQLVKNRREAIRVLESQKEIATVNLRAGI